MNLENPFLEHRSKPSSAEGLFSRLGALAEMSEKTRGDLEPRVLKYTDKLRMEIRDICGKYGAEKVRGLFEGLSSGKIKTVDRKDILKIASILVQLEKALDDNRVPASELPPAEAFKSMVEEVNEQIKPYHVENLMAWDSYRLENGKLTGVVVTSEDKATLPVIENVVVNEVEDENGNKVRFSRCAENIQIINGKLNGTVVANGKTELVVDGVIRHQEGLGTQIKVVEIIDGKINGMCYLGKQGRRWVPIIDGQKILTIQDSGGAERGIVNCASIKNVDGKLNGYVELDDGRGLPVINGVLQEWVPDKTGKKHKILGCDLNIKNVDGKLNGAFELEDGIEIRQDNAFVKETPRVAVINGVIVDTVQDQEGIEYPIRTCLEAFNMDDQLNGVVGVNERISDGVKLGEKKRVLPVIDGKLVDSVVDRTGRKRFILSCEGVRNTGGKLTGIVELSDERRLPVIQGRLIETVEYWDRGIDMPRGLEKFSDAGGLFSGEVKVAQGGEVKRVLMEKLLD